MQGKLEKPWIFYLSQNKFLKIWENYIRVLQQPPLQPAQSRRAPPWHQVRLWQPALRLLHRRGLPHPEVRPRTPRVQSWPPEVWLRAPDLQVGPLPLQAETVELLVLSLDLRRQYMELAGGRPPGPENH
jgi:hypothetical protein